MQPDYILVCNLYHPNTHPCFKLKGCYFGRGLDVVAIISESINDMLTAYMNTKIKIDINIFIKA